MFERYPTVLVFSLVGALNGCALLDQYYPDKRLDYLTSEEGPPLSMPTGLSARQPQPLLPIPEVLNPGEQKLTSVEAYPPTVAELAAEVEAIKSKKKSNVGMKSSSKRRWWWSKKPSEDVLPNNSK